MLLHEKLVFAEFFLWITQFNMHCLIIIVFWSFAI